VNYLGFPGTMGADYIDYLVADTHVIPREESEHYTERIVRLSTCYQANDRRQAIDSPTPSREECELPQEGFVYCCFNSVQKINPRNFEAWMRILKRVAGSVLWLLGSNPLAMTNIRRYASGLDVDPSRIVFASQTPHSRHLARYHNADLFLDTVPYNAHTTGSDAILVGCPILTVAGNTFAGRVCGSLLHAVGAPELIVGSLQDYEDRAVALGTDAGTHARLKQRFSTARVDAPLFDADRIARELESAYATMWARHVGGLPPESF
jgi:protein O-GlcNAc transferase